MLTATNFILVGIGFISICAGVIFQKKRVLLILFLFVGLLSISYPFVHNYIATRDAYEWKIIVYREIDNSRDPKVIFIRDIEWVTDYERIKGRRGSVRSFFFRRETIRKEFDVKGYIPVSIAANVLYGANDFHITRIMGPVEPGSYTFTLFFDENDRGSWTVTKTRSEN